MKILEELCIYFMFKTETDDHCMTVQTVQKYVLDVGGANRIPIFYNQSMGL